MTCILDVILPFYISMVSQKKVDQKSTSQFSVALAHQAAAVWGTFNDYVDKKVVQTMPVFVHGQG